MFASVYHARRMAPRPRLNAPDRALLWVLLPLFALTLGLHLRQVALTGVALPPI